MFLHHSNLKAEERGLPFVYINQHIVWSNVKTWRYVTYLSDSLKLL